jgi:hypothetical protein
VRELSIGFDFCVLLLMLCWAIHFLGGKNDLGLSTVQLYSLLMQQFFALNAPSERLADARQSCRCARSSTFHYRQTRAKNQICSKSGTLRTGCIRWYQ